MCNCRFNIAIVETSDIIYEGLHATFFNSSAECSIIRVDSLNELISTIEEKKVDFVIINPQNIQNRIRDIRKIRKQFPNILFIGIIVSLIDKEIQNVYNATYSIYDSQEDILSGMCRMIKNSHIIDTNSEDETLSERETEVLKLLIYGNSNKEIADSLNISIHTVVTHRKNITMKTGIRSQSGLTIYAISKNIVAIEDFS